MGRMDVDEKTREMNAIDERCRVLEDENLALKQELDEANAVIAACRNARGIVRQQVDMLKRSAWSDRASVRIRLDDYRTVLDLFDEVDGL